MKLKIATLAATLLATGLAFAHPHGDHGKHGGFGKLDSNKDGAISQAEACGTPKGAEGRLCKNFAAIDANKDGIATHDEMRAARFAVVAHKGFSKMDANADGAISQAEACGGPRGAQGKLCTKFGEIDANKDGALSKEELGAHMQAHKGKHHGG
jgi:hypothetical protein